MINKARKNYIPNLLITTSLSLITMQAMANPELNQVTYGDVNFEQNNNNLNITQHSDKAILEWNSFNIGTHEQVEFRQPSANSITLNRIIDHNPSEILGKLTANGQVILSNPNGVLFGKDALVNVGGLIATSADIRDEDFIAGTMNFSKPGKQAAGVINNGNINFKDAGIGAFVAPNVQNNGVIKGKLTKLDLASGEVFSLDMYGDQLIDVGVTKDLKEQLISNKGLIELEGGEIYITASAAKETVNNLIQIEGEIINHSITEKNGIITISGGNIDIATTANIDAPRGKIIVKANKDLKVKGKISADGGDGFVETSSFGGFDLDEAQVSAKGGEWLIDPYNITISSGANSNTSGTTDFTASATSAVLNTTTLQTAINGNTSVTVSTTGGGADEGNITVANSLAFAPAATSTLTLKANNNIVFNSGVGITATGNPLNLILNADSDASNSGAIRLTGTNSLTTNGGNIVMGGGANPATTPAYGNSTINQGISLTTSTINTGGGNFTANGTGYTVATGSQYGFYMSGGSLTATTGNVAIIGTGGNSVGNSNHGIYTLSASSISTTTGDIMLTGNGNGTGSSSIGILVNNGVISAETGNMDITGNGSNSGSGDGINMSRGSISSTGSSGAADMNITGYGGSAGGSGILLNSSTIATISTVSAPLNILALGGAGSTTNSSLGLYLWNNSSINSTGTGNININATGGNNLGGNNIAGLFLRGNTSRISSTTSDININVTGGSMGFNNCGLWAAAGSIITTATGNIIINGVSPGYSGLLLEGNISSTGASGSISLIGESGISNNSHGVYLTSTGSITSSSTTNISIIGTAYSLTNSLGILINPLATISSIGGNINLVGNAEYSNSGLGFGSTSVLTATAGNLTLVNNDNVLALGPTTAGGNLNVTSAGAITDQAAITIGGTSSFTTLANNAAITLDNASTYTGAVSLNTHGTGDAAITGIAGNLNLGNSVVGGKLIVEAAGNIIIDSGKTLSAAGSSSAITLAAGGNFINNAGATALATPNGGWQVYSTNPSSDTIGGLANDFRRFNCTYNGSCPAFTSSQKGLLYTYQPYISATPNPVSLTYSDSLSLSPYGYSLSGYLGSDVTADNVSGNLSGSTSYAMGSPIGTYNINHLSGILNSALGYGFNYNNNPSAITVNPKVLSIVNISANDKIYDATTSATLNTNSAALDGLITQDTANVNINSNAATGLFSDKNVGNNKAVTIQGFTIAGAASNNYSLTQPTTTANITPAQVSIIGTIANSKEFDGNKTAILNNKNSSLLGVMIEDKDSVNLDYNSAEGMFSDSAIGNNKIVNTQGFTISGAEIGNYNLSNQPILSADITSFKSTATSPLYNTVSKIVTSVINTVVNSVSNIVLSNFSGASIGNISLKNNIPQVNEIITTYPVTQVKNDLQPAPKENKTAKSKTRPAREDKEDMNEEK
jgi:filamentous hemagglutinin family protein